MMNSLKFMVTGRFNLADDESDDGTFYKVNSEIWRSIPSNLCERKYENRGENFTVIADWTEVINLTEKANLVMQASILQQKETGRFAWVGEYPINDISVPISVVTTSERKWAAQAIVESYLYDVFAIFNISLPGSADFLSLTLSKSGKFASSKIKLGSYYPYRAFEEFQVWPALQYLDIVVVEEWYSSVRVGASQIPNLPVERAIFGLFHICRSSGRPEDIVWLFYAFEALFQTRAGENFAAIVDRMNLLLKPTEKQAAAMKKRLREMYDLRSSFVHGGFKIIHPMHNEQLDSRVDDSYTPVIELSIYGVKLLLACIQNYVINNWQHISFAVTMTPSSIDLCLHNPKSSEQP